jgi:hypothetical protein
MRVVLGWDIMPAVLAASEMAADEPGFITAGLYSSAWTGRRMPALVLDCGRVARVGVWHDRALSLVETVAHEAMHAVQHAMAKADGDLWPPIEARLYGERGDVTYDDEGDLQSVAFMCALAESTGGNVRDVYRSTCPSAPESDDIAAWSAMPLAPLCVRMLAFRRRLVCDGAR